MRAAVESTRVAVSNFDHQAFQEVSDDPAFLCRMVRSLAAQSHRVLQRTPEANSDALVHDISELQGRIDRLQHAIYVLRHQRNCVMEDLQLWLDSLRRRVDAMLAQTQRDAEV